MTDTFSEQRRQQKRPGTQSVVLTEDLMECIDVQLPVVDGDASPVAKTLRNGINNFLKSSFSPDDYQKMMACVAGVWKTKEIKDQLSDVTVISIATKWFVPWLCRCDLRFVHKGLINLLRADVVMKNQIVRDAVIAAFSAKLGEGIDFLLNLYAAESDDAHNTKDGVKQPLYMRSANFIDAVSVSASPIFPQVFESLFSKSVKLCSFVLSECVITAINGSIDTVSIHSENLEEVRFVVRVVATHVHRHIAAISHVPNCDIYATPLSLILFSATAMLSTAAFPKDVLNAAGLLVATVLSSSHTSVSIEMVKALCEQNVGSSLSTTTDIRKAADDLMTGLLSPSTPLAAQLSSARSLFSRLVPNGRFAFYKGLLSHFSSPMEGKRNLILVSPYDSSNATVLHDLIFSTAKAYSDEQREPDTRFMAIQTLDHIVKYMSSTFKELTSNESSLSTTTLHAAGLTDVSLSVIVNKTRATVLEIVSIITGLWDDPTQQVSGPLYATYGNILDVSDAVQKLTKEEDSTSPAVDPLLSFQAALRVRADRRGKYHTMLALLGRLDDQSLLVALRTVNTACASYTDLSVFQNFVESLIVTANNPKICSVSGDLFAVMASRFLAKDSASGTATYWQECIIKAVTNVLTSPNLTTGLGVSDSMARGNIVTHMVTPILKQGAMGGKLLHDLLRDWAEMSSSAKSQNTSVYLIQATVDLLYRARASGVSLEGVGNNVWELVRIAGDAYDTTLRLAALSLLLLSTKASERVSSEQFDLALRLVRLYSQNGGDSTTRNDTLGILRLWLKRLVDSVGFGVKKEVNGHKDKKVDAESLVEEEAVYSTYVSLVIAHVKDIVACIVVYVSKQEGGSEVYLSSERRFFCYTMLEMVWGSVGAFFTDATSKIASHPAVLAAKGINGNAIDDLTQVFYPLALREPLKATLLEGWDTLRELGNRLLSVLCSKVGSANVFPKPKEELLGAIAGLGSGTHRVAQGGASVIAALLQYAWPDVVSALGFDASTENSPLPPITSDIANDLPSYAAKTVASLCAAIENECVMIDVLTNADMIRASPLHGRLILIGALFSSCLASSPNDQTVAIAQRILATCTKTTEYCSGLVSGSDKVDCRGHVFSEGDAAKESDNRVIVNNSWLGVRAACTISEKLLSVCQASAVGEESVLSLCKALVSTLLLTKHNGVMGKARAALRFICRLLLKTKSHSLRAIPTILINDLLGESGVGSSDEGRILRRSQGLPHAILPILEAEDASLPLVLFPKTMNVLLELIEVSQRKEATSSLAIAHSINSLNVLKFIFDNSIFASRVTPWAQDAFIKAAKGFTSGNWAVRNSSLMLFSSVIHRVVGDHPSKGGGGVTTSLHDLQQRLPNGLTYALEELTAAVERTAGGFAVDPALFPLLLLFSMLCPDAPHVVHDRSSAHIVSQLVTVLQRCGSLRNVMARAASGSALVAIVPVADLDGIVTDLIESTITVGATETIDQNTVHGNIQHLQKIFAHYVGTLRIDVKNTLGAHANETTRTQIVSLMQRFVTADADAVLSKIVLCMPVAATFIQLAADIVASISVEGSDAECGKRSVVGITANAIAVARTVVARTAAANVSGYGHMADIGSFSDAVALLISTAVHVLAKCGATAADCAPLTAVMTSMGLAGESLVVAPSSGANFNTFIREKVLSTLATYHRASSAQRFSSRAYMVRCVFSSLPGSATSSSSIGGISAGVILMIAPLLGVDVIAYALGILKQKIGNEGNGKSLLHPQVCEDAFTVLSIIARDPIHAGVVSGSSVQLPSISAMCSLIATEENSGMRGALLEFVATVVAERQKISGSLLTISASPSVKDLLGAVEVASRPDQPTPCRLAAVYALGTVGRHAGAVLSTALNVALASLWLRLLHDDEEEVRRCSTAGIKHSVLGSCVSIGVAKGITLSQPFTVEALAKSVITDSTPSRTTSVDAYGDTLEAATPFVDAVFNSDVSADYEDAVDDDEDADLFDEEQDNMYWEPSVMSAIRNKMKI